MKALSIRAGKKALEDRPMPEIAAPTDAIVRIVKTTICGTDLHILKGDVPSCTPGRILGHEGIASWRVSVRQLPVFNPEIAARVLHLFVREM